MTTRFQSLEQSLSWFSPCVAFCAAPFIVIIAVYGIIRLYRLRTGDGPQSPYDPTTNAPLKQVNTKDIAYTKPPSPNSPQPPPAP
jgi:hypothetical protein